MHLPSVGLFLEMRLLDRPVDKDTKDCPLWKYKYWSKNENTEQEIGRAGNSREEDKTMSGANTSELGTVMVKLLICVLVRVRPKPVTALA